MQNSPLYKRVDLHCHSTFSDGTLTPSELVNTAKKQNLDLLALTDHDTLSGLSEARKAATDQGIIFISGVELSIQWKGLPLHMVVLDFDSENEVLNEIVVNNQLIRDLRAKNIALQLQKKGLPDLYDKAFEIAGAGQIGRPHFAKAMVEYNIVKDIGKAFDKYLGNKHLGMLKSVWPEMDKVIPPLSNTKCDLVLAHPKRYSMNLSKLKKMIAEFTSLGGGAIEVSSGNEAAQSVRVLESLCRDFQLEASVGSDFHSPLYSWSQLGKYTSIEESKVKPIWHKWLK